MKRIFVIRCIYIQLIPLLEAQTLYIRGVVVEQIYVERNQTAEEHKEKSQTPVNYCYAIHNGSDKERFMPI